MAKEEMKKKESAEQVLTLRQQAKKFKMNDMIVPILSIAILIILTIFIYIPTLTSAFDSKSEIKDIEGKIETLEKLENSLDSISILDMQQDLSNSKDVIPYTLQVSNFVYYIDNLAKENNLVFKDIFAGDIKTNTNGALESNQNVSGVSGPLQYSGSLENITEFLNGLQSASPFIVSTDSIDIKHSEESDTWDVSLSVTGYYIAQDSYDFVNLYTQFIPYRRFEEVIDVFKTKSEKLQEDTKEL